MKSAAETEKVRKREKRRNRVSLAAAALWLGAILSPEASAASISERCQNLFRSVFPPAPSRRAAPRRSEESQIVRIVGARGPGEEKLRAYVAEVNELLGEMKLPPQLEIDFTDSTAMSAHYLTDRLTVVISPKFARDTSANGERIKRTFVQHEYGHAVFDANFGRYSEDWQKWHDQVSRPKLAEIPGMERPVSLDRRPPSRLFDLTVPYQELFADLMAVVAQKDPRAVSDAVGQFVSDTHQIENRSFRGLPFDARWSEPPGPEGWPNRNSHLFFAPVRRHLWDQYFSRPENHGKEAAMVRIVFDTIATDILAREKDPALRHLSFSQLSARLLRALDKSLAVYKLK